MNETELVYIDEYGLLGTNFYWHKFEAKGLTKEEVLNAGLLSDRVQVHRDIIDVLVKVDKEFQDRNCRLYIKEGYRSKALYEIVYQRRVEKFGREATERQLNMKDMPHSIGLSIDVALWSLETDAEVYMRNWEDGDDALFIDFYKNKEDAQGKVFQELQEWVIKIMQKNGFRLGTKNEYFHFDFRPNLPENYPKKF